MDTFLQDLRYAARGLLHRPAFAAVAVITLAIGIGANTAIFSAVNAALLRPLPFREPERLMALSLTTPAMRGEGPRDDMVWSFPKYRFFRNAQSVFTDMAAYTNYDGVTLSGGTIDPERVQGEEVTGRYLPLLGVTPVHGRSFLPEEDAAPGAPRVVIIGEELWKRRFNANPSVLGETVDIDAQPFTIVGVLPPGFHGLTGTAELWTPLMARAADEFEHAWAHEFRAVARLAPGVTPAQAVRATAVLGTRIAEEFPDPIGRREGWGARARLLDDVRVDSTLRQSLIVLAAAVGFVLLIACVNIANLLLARAATRRREIALRLAVGASRARLVRQLLTESVLLALVGALASVAVAWWGVRLLSALNPTSTSFAQGQLSGLTSANVAAIHLDVTALAFTFGVALVTGILFGLVPALQTTRPGLTEALKEGAGAAARGGAGASRGQRRGWSTRSALVVSEVALALVLLIGSGLMVKSLGRLLAIDPGFDPSGVLSMRLSIPDPRYHRDSMPGFYTELLARLGGLPGVTSVAVGNCPPLAGGCNATTITFPDKPPVAPGSTPLIGVHFISPDWLQVMRVPLLRGRPFTTADRLGAPKVVLVSETAARRFWPNDDPIGKRVGVMQGGFSDGATVVGVVGDVRFGTIDSLPRPDVYISYLQSPRGRMMIFLRTAGGPLSLVAAARGVMRETASGMPLFDVRTMTDRVSDATAQMRFSAVLLALFGAVALALAAIGIYGVISFLVTQRTREIGIRIALGALRGDVVRLVAGQAALLVGLGVAVGLVAALLSTRALRSLLYDVTPSDPGTYVVIALGLGAIAALAAYLPARRATKVDPMVALREE